MRHTRDISLSILWPPNMVLLRLYAIFLKNKAYTYYISVVNIAAIIAINHALDKGGCKILVHCVGLAIHQSI